MSGIAARSALALHRSHWPAFDINSWDRAMTPGEFLGSCGPAAHWAPTTREVVANAYGRWLAWLQENRPDQLALSPGTRVTPGSVTDYLAYLKTESKRTGPFVFVRGLYDAIRVLEPSMDWSWLRDIKWPFP